MMALKEINYCKKYSPGANNDREYITKPTKLFESFLIRIVAIKWIIHLANVIKNKTTDL